MNGRTWRKPCSTAPGKTPSPQSFSQHGTQKHKLNNKPDIVMYILDTQSHSIQNMFSIQKRSIHRECVLDILHKTHLPFLVCYWACRPDRLPQTGGLHSRLPLSPCPGGCRSGRQVWTEVVPPSWARRRCLSLSPHGVVPLGVCVCPHLF